MGFVIYLSSEQEYDDYKNAYGYWTGKWFTVQGIEYPITYMDIDDETKIYKSRKKAEKSAEKLFLRFGYVLTWRVEEVAD